MNVLLPALAGLAAGVLSGFGVGGGTLLVLWLTLFAHTPQREAGGINLVFFLCCALPALWGHLKNKRIDKPAALWAAAAGLPACVLGAVLAGRVDTTLLRRAFGALLLWVGLRELFSQPPGNSPPHNAAPAGHPRGGAQNPNNPKGVATMRILDRIALLLAIIGGVNWGLVGIFRFDLVAWLCGGQAAVVARIIYTLVGIAALWCLTLLFRDRDSERA